MTTMEFRKVLALRGPSIWAHFPVLEAWVDLGELKDSPSDTLPGFNERLMAWLPSLVEHRCSFHERGGFFERLRRGTYQAHVLEHVALELQILAGSDVRFARVCVSHEEGIHKIAVEYEEETLGLACLESARGLCLAAVHDRPFDLDSEVVRLRDLAHQVRLGPSTGSLVAAAKRRGIPTRRLSAGSLVQLGHGAKARRILTAETDRTGAIAQEIAQDKDLTRSLLQAIGVPVPDGRAVSDAEDAWEAAQEIEAPVVVKPQRGNQGRGVATNLSTREQVLAAYAAARQEEPTVVVERFAPGDDYRVLVVGERVVAASRREPAQVFGDGVHSIARLVEEVNRDPRRSDGHATALSRIRLDNPIAQAVLAEQGYTVDSVPPVGTRVLIRRNANLSTGGTATDVTDAVHPEVAARCVEAAQVVGLDVAGIDVVALDISRPLEEQRGVIVEVNAGPGLRMHLEPSAGTPRPVGEAIIDMMFPPGEDGRIPIVAITGTNGKTTTTRLVAHIVATSGMAVGMTCTDGIYIAGRRIDSTDCAGPASAQAVLMNPKVEAAVFETARGGILRAGLGFDRCDVAVVTNIGEGDHLGIADIETLEQLARVKRTPVEAVRAGGTAVLKADDLLVADMASYCRGSILFFARDGEHPVLAEHRRGGGRATFVRDDAIVLAAGDQETVLIDLDRVPVTHNGRIAFQVENVLAAAAAAWAQGVSLEAIREGLETFGSGMQGSPGRFNLLEIGGVTVVLDYGHNTSALSALIEAVAPFPHDRRTVVYSAAGDRRDEDMVRQGEMLGDAFDRVVLYEDHYLRGRVEGEIIGLFRQGLREGSRVSHVHGVRGALESVKTALCLAQPGELLVIQPDKIDETLDFIRSTLRRGVTGREIDATEALEAVPEGGAVAVS
jgi:cyanophycin synthetase